ncbi:MAG: sensor histidine kinase [Anaerolineae bacterium]
MRVPIGDRLKPPSLAQQFMLTSFVILVAGMIVIGWWVGQEIEAGVINRTAATTALYVDSFVAPQVQELGRGAPLTAGHQVVLGRLLHDTRLGQHIVAFKIWDAEGRIVYSTEPSNIGRFYSVHADLADAWQGRVSSGISDLQEEENVLERGHWTRLLETYSPVRQTGTDRIIAVAEFYQTVDDLQGEIVAAQTRSWLIVGAATLAMYLLLTGMVRRGSDTIERQQLELRDKVRQLTELLEQNRELHRRVRRAATRTTALNERFLRRISAELHDGPAQDLGLALLRLDSVVAACAECPIVRPEEHQVSQDLDTVQSSLERALEEVRAIAAGLRLPELDDLTLHDTLGRVVRVHERRTDTETRLQTNDLPEQAPLPVKITLYRLIQEALSNAYRHGGGVGQRVHVDCDGDNVSIEVSDEGPGFNVSEVAGRDGHLGLAGMRERVESLGGLFRIDTEPGRGTRVVARLPLRPVESDDA